MGSRPGLSSADRLLTTREVAEFLGLSPETVLRRWRYGELPSYRLGSNVLRFRESEIEAWLEGTRPERPLVSVRGRRSFQNVLWIRDTSHLPGSLRKCAWPPGRRLIAVLGGLRARREGGHGAHHYRTTPRGTR